MRPRARHGPLPLHLRSFGAVALSLAPCRRAGAARRSPSLRRPPPIDAPQPTRALTMAEALAYARAHQPAIRRGALARVRRAWRRRKIPSGQWLPTVGVTRRSSAMTANNTTGDLRAAARSWTSRASAATPRDARPASFSPYAVDVRRRRAAARGLRLRPHRRAARGGRRARRRREAPRGRPSASTSTSASRRRTSPSSRPRRS